MNTKSSLHLHLLGICGTGMAALAGILQELGHRVSGSDEQVYPPMSTFLEKLGITVQIGYRPENLNPAPDVVVVGNVIRRENPEAQAVLEKNLPRLSLPEALNHFLVAGRQSIVVAGTHGKTTTTALIAWLLHATGRDPGFMVGGIAKNFQSNYRVGTGPYVVLEGDEYDTAFFDKRPKFLHFQPHLAVLTSVEFDHADIYADLDAVKRSFESFLAQTPPASSILACGDAPSVREVCRQATGNVEYYGLGEEVTWRAAKITPGNGGARFTLVKDGTAWGEFFLPLLGVHNVLNATAALAVLAKTGGGPAELQAALLGFQGVRRRLEKACELQEVLILDDFAHHPTEVAATLAAVRQGYPGRRLLAVFEPRTNTSRRKVFQKPYIAAFAEADLILVREPPDLWKVPEEDRFSSWQLVQDLISGGKKAFYFPDTDHLFHSLCRGLRPRDVVAVMSNGHFDHLVTRLCQALGASENPGL
jgi:UDP-N-acetylmuramate: L-alanyl-gamma-D-glutamyl-meso-diaminopimelate ligase